MKDLPPRDPKPQGCSNSPRPSPLCYLNGKDRCVHLQVNGKCAWCYCGKERRRKATMGLRETRSAQLSSRAITSRSGQKMSLKNRKSSAHLGCVKVLQTKARLAVGDSEMVAATALP